MHDIAEFLGAHPPFDSLDEDALAKVAASAEIEFHAGNAPILDRAEATSESAYVVRRGSVELVIDGRLLDLRGEGEMFGFASLLHEGPMGFVARAAEDTLVYKFPAEAIRPVLERPAAARFLATSLSKRAQLLAGHDDLPAPEGGRRVGDLIRARPLVLAPEVSVQEAARGMAERGVTCVVVDLGEQFGIVTDRDIRTRVVAGGVDPATPLSAVMTAPARTVADDRLATEALLEMLDYGVRHLLVLERGRRLVGVLDDIDLMASERRAPFRLRAQIARSADPAGVAAAAAQLPETVMAVHDAGMAAHAVCRIIASIHDTVTRRLIELAHDELGRPPVPYTWLAMGSFGRREPFPSSDVDCALAWDGPGDDEELRRQLTTLAERVLEGVAASGFKPDPQGALASKRLFARSIGEWEKAARGWVEDPDEGRGLMLMSVVVESSPVWGATAAAERLSAAFASAPGHDQMLRRLAAAALAERPPTGFLRDFVLHSSGERKGVLDIKRGGLLPIESLARWAGLAAGVRAASTQARLKAAEEQGTLEPGDAATLREAYELVCELRMEHQVEQLRAGEPPDNLISPKNLTPLSRTALKSAFRAVARVQRGIGTNLGLSPR